MILSRVGSHDLRGRLETLVFALDDPDVLKVFLKSVESDDVEEQRVATKTLSWAGAFPTRVHDVLNRLQQRSDLDAKVAANIKTAIDRIENKVPVKDK